MKAVLSAMFVFSLNLSMIKDFWSVTDEANVIVANIIYREGDVFDTKPVFLHLFSSSAVIFIKILIVLNINIFVYTYIHFTALTDFCIIYEKVALSFLCFNMFVSELSRI
jgi:hypothetical protein